MAKKREAYQPLDWPDYQDAQERWWDINRQLKWRRFKGLVKDGAAVGLGAALPFSLVVLAVWLLFVR